VTVLMNNCRGYPHAKTYGSGAFFDMGKTGKQAQYDLSMENGQLCVVIRRDGDNDRLDWWKFTHAIDRLHPEDGRIPVRVFFGEWVKSVSLTRGGAIKTDPYCHFFDKNGNFKRHSILRR
jgi:hypothetical protein